MKKTSQKQPSLRGLEGKVVSDTSDSRLLLLYLYNKSRINTHNLVSCLDYLMFPRIKSHLCEKGLFCSTWFAQNDSVNSIYAFCGPPW